MGTHIKTHTRHKEYSLLVAAVMGTALYLLSTPSNIFLLLLLNAFSIFSILYSAFSVVRHADVLAHRFGEPFGSLILSLSIVILESGLISVLMLSGSAGKTLMRDTVYSVIIIVMTGFIGISLLLGGRKYISQYFNFSGTKHFLTSITLLALIVFALPATLEGNTFTSGQLVVIAIACLLVYMVFLRIQTVTHRNFFVYEDEDDDGLHGKPSAHSTAWHFALLGVHLVAVIGLTKLNSEALQLLLTRMHAPAAFSGFLVALLILSPEGTGAFRSVLQNQVQRAMNLLLGSVLATISLTIPLVVLIAALTDQELVFSLDLPSIFLMFTTFMVCQTSLTGGETNVHSGAAHVVLFMIYIMLLFR